MFFDGWNLGTTDLVPVPSVAKQVQNAGGRPDG